MTEFDVQKFNIGSRYIFPSQCVRLFARFFATTARIRIVPTEVAVPERGESSRS